MSGWLTFAGYLAILTIVWRIAFTIVVDRGWETDEPSAAVMSGVAAILWPITLVTAPIFWFVTRPTPGQQREKRERERREQEREAERIARKYDLPMPPSPRRYRSWHDEWDEA